MKLTILLIILISTFFASAYLIWRFLFCHLFRMEDKLSLNIREKIFPDMQKTANILVSLAAAAIVLTFSMIKILNPDVMSCKVYLISSWISFALTVLFGIGSMVILYILRAQYMIVIHDCELAEQEENDKVVNELGPSLDKARKIQRSMHILLYSQAVTFFGGIIFLVIFAIGNL